MRAIVVLLLSCLWLPAHAVVPPCSTIASASSPTCRSLGLGGVVRGKTFVDLMAEAVQVQRGQFATENGAFGWLNSAEIDGKLAYQIEVDAGSPLALAAFTLSRDPSLQDEWVWLENAPGDLAPDLVLRDTLNPGNVSFVFANGLGQGQASRWLVDIASDPPFTAAGLGSASDVAGGISAAKPLLAPVPEPASAALLLAGLATLRLRRRRG